MILITIKKCNSGYLEFKSEGHASQKFGKRGNNILCAAISVLAQTLGIHLESKGLLQEYFTSEEEGSSRFVVNEKYVDQATIPFETILSGINTLSRMHPKEVQVKICT